MQDSKHSNLPKLLTQLAGARHRQLLLVTGNPAWCYEQSEKLLTNADNCLVLSNHTTLKQASWPEHLHQILGQEFDHLVYDGFSGILPNKIAAASGTVKAGGLLLLLLPELDTLEHWLDPAITRWSSEGQTPKHSHFLKRWQQLWQHAPVWQISEQHGVTLPDSYMAPSTSMHGIEEQQEVLTKIVTALEKKRSPILLSADRGRGKSALLGLLAARLSTQQFVICSRHFHALHSCFAMLAHALNTPVDVKSKKLANLRYLAPDALLQQASSLDSNTIILVDEAAALPVPFLTQVTQLGLRCVFSSTLVGYEGNGRGYTLRFKQYLALHHPNYLDFTLQCPIRYAPNDPLERQIRDLFALECHIPAPTSAKQLTMRAISQSALVKDTQLLEQVFSLLVLAHYQTSVDDLRQLLDAPDLHLHGAFCEDKLVAICLAVVEGGLPEALATDILLGKRRPAGHLMSQQLATTFGEPQFITSHSARVIRIAVHPALQHRGIGSQLLQAFEHSLPDHITAIGTSFGLTAPLLNFWHKLGYQPLKIGFKQDKASGEFALLMLKTRKKALSLAYTSAFKQGFFYQLRTTYQYLDVDTVSAVLTTLPVEPFTNEQLSYLHFINQGAPSEQQVCPFLWQLLTTDPQLIKKLTKVSKALIIRLILQQHSTQVVQQQLGLSGKKALVTTLRETVQQVYENVRC
ncbi:GNAT family N-acetyltransferase [Pseudoalteromonas piscicida]|uniref:GNAT family N-acetyltransferase n=1 Tax=Pseudoalteromonas piscicida TaxID=43662 RepID=UPI0030A2331A